MIRAVFALLVTSLASSSVAQTYVITDLGLLPGDTASASIGINFHGQIVGCSDTSTIYYPCNGGSGHAFLWGSKTGMQDLGVLRGDVISAAVNVNNLGEVVGYSINRKQVYHAFSWTAKTGMIALRKLPGGTTNSASAINAAGLIVGGSDFKNSNGSQHAVLWTQDGKIQDLGTLPGAQFAAGNGINTHQRVSGLATTNSTVAAFVWTTETGIQALPGLTTGGATVSFAINNPGTIVGNAETKTGFRHPVLWTAAGKIRDIGALPGGFGTAFGINDLNQIVGYSTDSSNNPHAFLWSAKAGIQDLNDLIPAGSGWVLVWASAINNAGQISGWGTINGENHAYLLTP